ncbi:MAG: DUF4157 domain-containing protein [Microthrixaceae bacterium]|nr:DUF4157 domain-containing protein [Microthrixaceae bacterium]MCO5313111.1 DUF4157 domain-containing protein [Microthrixaceae bacterium]HPB44413.1 DUF4157 domain-containing protein [Microthrixaceae bacterium]
MIRRESGEGYTVWLGAPVPRGATAITFGRHILMRPRGSGNEHLLRHELIHVRQWQEHGVVRFAVRYLGAYLRGRWRGYGHWDAYRRIPLEIEAEWGAQRMSSTGPR